MNQNNLNRKDPSVKVHYYPSNISETNHSRLITHYLLKRKTAFTLSEVLITLGIIAVVAALTLPTLIANYQKKNLVTQLKKSVSTIEQGFTTMLADEEVESLADTDVFKAINGSCIASEGLKNSGCDNFYPKLKKYFNIIDVRETGSDFKHRNINPNASFQNPDNRTDGAMIVLADGAILYSYNISSSEQKSPYSCDYIHSKGGTMCAKMGNFAIDVNGKKKPNVTGRDVFVFYISSTGHLVPLWSKNDLIYAEGNDRRSWIYNSSACGTYGKADAEEKATYGTGCAARIIENGWEMDY